MKALGARLPIVLVAGLSVGTISCEQKKEEAPPVQAEPQNATANQATAAQALGAEPAKAPKAKQPKVQILHIDVAEDLGGIQPCVKIRTNLYERGLKKEKLHLHFSIQYTSRGARVTKDIDIPFKDLVLAPDHPQHTDGDKKDKQEKKFTFLDARISVSGQPVDRGTTPTGTVEVVKIKQGGGRAPASDAELDEIEAESD
jgi:hypothetical protein